MHLCFPEWVMDNFQPEINISDYYNKSLGKILFLFIDIYQMNTVCIYKCNRGRKGGGVQKEKEGETSNNRK